MEYINEISVQLVQHMGGDHMVAAAAKVSTNGEAALQWADPTNEAEITGNINYLMAHRHGTSFEHNSMTFFVHAPIFVWREWHRHRIGFSYNEESGRYKKLSPTFYIPRFERPMKMVPGWKAGRPKFESLSSFNDNDNRLYQRLVSNLKTSYEAGYTAYEENLSLGIDPGLARDCLPVGIYSSCWVTCNARSLMAFLSLRTHHPEATFVSYPLWEIENAAEQLEVHFSILFPKTHAAFVKNGRVGP